jgi:hypothetical protein
MAMHNLMARVCGIFLMLPLTLADGLCRDWFTHPVLCWCWCLQTWTSSIVWAQLSRLLPDDRDTIQSQKGCILNKKPDDG